MLMQAAAHIEDLLARHRYREACIRMESLLLDGCRLSEPWLRCLPEEQLYVSPLLLQELGELSLSSGKLQEALRLLDSAVKGYSAMAFPDRLLTAMSWLSQTLLRLGQLNEAETLLTFLKEEHERTPAAARLDGAIPLALAAGNRLIDGSDRRAEWYRDAIDCFERRRQYKEAASALANWLLDNDAAPHVPIGDGIAWRIGQWHAAGEGLDGMAAWLQALLDAAACRWERAYRGLQALLDSGWQAEADYAHAAYAEAVMLRAELELQNGEAESRLRAVRSLRTKHAADIQLAYRLLHEEHAGRMALGQLDEAQTALAEAAIIGRYLQLPPSQAMEAAEESPAAEVEAAPVRLSQPEDGRGSWRVRFFGGLCFERGTNEIRHIRWKRRKAQELCICLLLQPRYAYPKEQLVELLQLGEDEKKAIRQLYVIIHQLKQTLLEQLGIDEGAYTREGLVMLREDAFEYVDTERYQALLRIAEPLWSRDRALSHELYQEAYLLYGELLPELPYLGWLDNLRVYMQERQIAVIRRLRHIAEDRQDSASEESYCQEWIRLAPYGEEAHGYLLRMLLRRGRYGEAQLVYARYAELCREEWGAEPSEDIRALMRRVGVEGIG